MNVQRNGLLYLQKRGLLGMYCLLVCSVFFVSSCGKGKEETAEEIVRPVKMLTVSSTEDALVREFPGRVRASQRVDMSFQVSGPLITLPIKEGQKVEKGDLLAQIDPKDFDVNLRNAEGQLAKARAALDLAQSLYERVLRIRDQDPGAVSEAMIDQKREDVNRAQAEVTSLQATVDAAKDRLRYTRLEAPFSGTIARRYVENFQKVQAKEPILSLQDIATVEILVDVPENIIARMNKGDEINVFAEFVPAPGRQFPLTAKEYATEADPRTQTYRIVFTMPSPEGVNILPGMTATVKSTIVSGTEGNTLIVPALAVFADEAGTSSVWVIEKESMTVTRRKVTTGSLTGKDTIQILSGLKDGDVIAVSGVSKLREGMKVRHFEQ